MKNWFLLLIALFCFSECFFHSHDNTVTNGNCIISTPMYADTIQNGYGIFYGNLYDKRTGKPIASGIISIDSTKIWTKTDSNGYYKIRMNTGHYILSAMYVANRLFFTKAIVLNSKTAIRIDYYLGENIQH